MKRQIDDIQILRAVAAIAVLFFHIERPIYRLLKAWLPLRKTTEVPA